MRFKISEYTTHYPLEHTVYLVIDTLYDTMQHSYDELSDDYAYTNALERCKELNTIFEEANDDY